MLKELSDEQLDKLWENYERTNPKQEVSWARTVARKAEQERDNAWIEWLEANSAVIDWDDEENGIKREMPESKFQDLKSQLIKE